MKGWQKFLAGVTTVTLLNGVPGCTSLEKKINEESRTPKKELAMDYVKSKLPEGISRRLTLDNMIYLPNAQSLKDLGIYDSKSDSLLNYHDRLYNVGETGMLIGMNEDTNGKPTFKMYFQATKE